MVVCLNLNKLTMFFICANELGICDSLNVAGGVLESAITFQDNEMSLTNEQECVIVSDQLVTWGFGGRGGWN